MPKYPMRTQSNGEEGWVQLHAMISSEGKEYDIVVKGAVGHDSFASAATNARRRSKFNPGTFNDEPVISVYPHKIKFSIEGGNRNRYFPAFRPVFSDVITSVRDEIVESAANQLIRLGELRKTLYEDALYRTAKFYFERE